MNEKKRHCVAKRSQEECIVYKANEVLEADPFHWRHDIPAMKDQDQGEHQRICNKGKKENDIGKNEQVAVHIALFQSPNDTPVVVHLFHSTMSLVLSTASCTAWAGVFRPNTAHTSYSCEMASKISLRSGAASIPRV